MTSEPSPDNYPSRLDESYWAALFQQEEAAEPKPMPNLEEETWFDNGERADGRFGWQDSDKPPTEDPWAIAQEHYEADKTLQLLVTGYNKGGLLVQWNGLQGFVPASQLIDFPQFHVERERLRALKQWRNKLLNLKIIEVNRATKRLILSERAAQVKAEEREDLLMSLRAGDIVTGQVTNLTNFGVFVDLGGVEGLIHISELSWSRVVHPSDILQPGEEVNVQILDINRENERVALSLKRLRRDPWKTVEERYQPGQLVKGVVSNVANFGAFVLLEDELEGLIHISELAEGTFLHPRNVVRKGETVRARVLHVDGQKKRLALSLRGVTQP